LPYTISFKDVSCKEVLENKRYKQCKTVFPGWQEVFYSILFLSSRHFFLAPNHKNPYTGFIGLGSPSTQRRDEMTNFNINYAHTIKNADQLNHHLNDLDNETILIIKEQFFKDKDKKKLFEKATRGWGV
jgi:hypothetical protein